MNDLSIYIRTCTYRQEESKELKAVLEENTNYKVLRIDCETQKNYSEAFVLNLAEALHSDTSKHILILEDDMLVSNRLEELLDDIEEFELPYCWLSLPNANPYTFAQEIGRGFHTVAYESFYYSGAIYFRKDILKDYCNDYLNNFLDFHESKFDVSVSKFMIKATGHFFFRGGFFGTNKLIESSFKHEQNSVKVHRLDIEAEDPYFDPNETLGK